MKQKILLPVLMILFATLLLAVMPTEADAAIYTDTVRLHVLADSDSEEDQKIKLAVRDDLLLTYASVLGTSDTVEEAEENIRQRIPEMRSHVNDFLARHGVEYSADITFSTEWYDTRVYESFTLPAGYYPSVRVLLGKAEGQNWWCVMFPPLCLDMATEDAPTGDRLGAYSDTERNLICGEYRVRFKLLEAISGAFRNVSGRS